MNMKLTFKNYCGLGYCVNSSSSSLSKTALRGGPYLRSPASLNYWWYAHTDHRKDFRFNFGSSQSWNKYGHSHHINFWTNFSYRPHSTMDISINPYYTVSENNLQYVSTEEFGQENHYIMGAIERNTLGISLRLNLSLTPDLSIQYWGQPFIANGDYTDFKRITDSKADNYEDRFKTFTGNEITYQEDDELYEIDADRDGNTDYSISNPNFKVFQFKSNLVARWEYIPGSTLFIVWSQNRDYYITDGPFQFKQDFKNLYDIFPHNVFLVKLTYRLGL